jgi:hypothetical protein
MLVFELQQRMPLINSHGTVFQVLHHYHNYTGFIHYNNIIVKKHSMIAQ